jgi:hypothetical protein
MAAQWRQPEPWTPNARNVTIGANDFPQVAGHDGSTWPRAGTVRTIGYRHQDAKAEVALCDRFR